MAPEVGTGQLKIFPFMSNYHPPCRETELKVSGTRKNINIVTTHPSQSGKCITGQNPGKGQTWNICVGYSEWDTNQSLYPPNFCSVKSESTSSKSRVKV